MPIPVELPPHPPPDDPIITPPDTNSEDATKGLELEAPNFFSLSRAILIDRIKDRWQQRLNVVGGDEAAQPRPSSAAAPATRVTVTIRTEVVDGVAL